MLTPYEVRREFTRGRGETITLSVIVNLFVGLIAIPSSIALFHDNPLPGLLLTGFTFGFPIWKNRRTRQLRAATLGLNAAYRAISQGRLGEAEELLFTVQSFTKARWATRLVLIQRALIGLRRGDLPGARAALDEAIQLPEDGRFKSNSGYQIEGAHAMRAFVLAGLGDREGALAESAWVRALPQPSPEALARVALAEALLLERAGEREALRDLLDRERALLLEHTHPRERAIVRAFQRMLKVSQSSVYRERAPDSAAGTDEPELDDWVARIAPGAAQFVRKGKRERAKTPQQAAREAADRQREVQQAHQALQYTVAQAQFRQPFVAMPGQIRNTSSTSQRNVLVLFGIIGVVALIIAATGLSSVLSSTPDVSAPGVEAPSVGGPLVALLFGALALGGTTYAVVRRAYKRRLQREQLAPAARAVRLASSAAATGSSTPDLAALTEGPDDVLAAQGHMLIASAAEKRGEWVLVLQECDKGIARLWSPQNQARSDILYPDLHSLRAFALACLGRYADAEAALRWLGATYPHYERAMYRVRLVELLQSVGAKQAATFAETYALELPLSVREELLSDLARAVAAPESAGLGEIARLREEIEKTENARGWISSICPGLLQAFLGQQEADISDLGTAAKVATEEELAEAELEDELERRQVRQLFSGS